MQRGDLVPPGMEQHFVDNMSRTTESYAREVAGLGDLLLTCRGVPAFAAAGHHQFVAPRQVLLQALPQEWSGQLMGGLRELETAIDRLGYLRLSPAVYHTRLMGNLISPEMAALAAGSGFSVTAPVLRQPRGLLRRVLGWNLVNGVAFKVYDLMFRILNYRART